MKPTSIQPDSHKTRWLSEYRRELTVAMAVKFTLLAAIWWLFVADHKPTINDSAVASQLFGATASINQHQEHPQ